MDVVGTSAPGGARSLVPVAGYVLTGILIGAAVARLGSLALFPVFGVLLVSIVVVRPQYGIALFLSTFLMSYPRWLQGSGYLTINNALGAIFLLLLVYRVYRGEELWFLKAREMQIFGLIILVFYISGRFNSPDPIKAQLLGAGFYFAEGLRTFANRVAFTLFLVVFIRTPANLRMLTLVALAFMVFTALSAVQTALRGGGFAGYRAAVEAADGVSITPGQPGLIRTAGNPNRLAMLSIVALGSLWYLMQWLRSPLMRLLILPTMALLALSVFLAASRSGLLGLLVCTVAILTDRGGFELRKILSIAAAAAVLLVLVAALVPERNLERMTNVPGTAAGESGEGAGSIERRRGGIDIAVELARDNPILGVGMGNWHVARFLKDPGYRTSSAHNSFLLALVEGGPFVLVSFLVLFWWTWQNLQFADAYVSAPFSPLGELSWIVKSSKVHLLVLLFFSLVADLWNFVILFMIVGYGVVLRRFVEQSMREDALAA